jgi:hypothetical protein
VFEPVSGHVGFVVDKMDWGRFSLSTSVSPAEHSTDCSTLIIIIIIMIIRGWYSRPVVASVIVDSGTLGPKKK